MVRVVSKAIVRMPPIISAVIVSHLRHGLRRVMGRRISEQVGCIVVCFVLCTGSVIVGYNVARETRARLANPHAAKAVKSINAVCITAVII